MHYIWYTSNAPIAVAAAAASITLEAPTCREQWDSICEQGVVRGIIKERA